MCIYIEALFCVVFFMHITLKLLFLHKIHTAFLQSQYSKCLLSNCSMPGSVLGPRETAVTKKNKLMKLTFYSNTFFPIIAYHLV